MENLEIAPRDASKIKKFHEFDRAEKGEILNLQLQKKRDEALKNIIRLKNKPPNSFVGLDLKDINPKRLKPEDLDAYYESFIEKRNGWYEKSEDFKAYEESIRDYKEGNKLGNLGGLKDSRLIFSGMIRQKVVDRTRSKMSGETIQ